MESPDKGGEYEFHSIMYNTPAYRNTKNDYLVFDGDTWLITDEDCFLDDVSCGWLRIDSRGTPKLKIIFNIIFCRKKSYIAAK